MTVLTKLAERVEKADRGSRKLDAEIAVAMKLGVPDPQPEGDLVYLKITRPFDQCAPGTYWRHSRSGASLHTAPAFSTSVDAALSLVPPDYTFWHVSAYSDGSAECWLYPKTPPAEPVHCEDAATPALAIVAACLKTLEALK